MLETIIFSIYRFLAVPGIVFLLSFFKFLLPRKLQQMVRERSTPQRQALLSRPILIHASSGEIEYAKPVIREIKKQFPHISVLVTYFSPSALPLIKGIEGLDAYTPLPWDHRQHVKRFLDYADPIAVLFSRTDVWPEFSYQLCKRKIPTLLFSATISDESSRLKGVTKFLTAAALRTLSDIYCVNDEDKRLFASLKIKTPIQVLGDTRFDQVLYRLQNPLPLKEKLRPKNSHVLVAGSTWPQDEAVILKTLTKFIADDGFVIIAPHEVGESRILDLENQLDLLNLKHCRYSQSVELSSADVLIVDQIGILPEVYGWGTVAFVGGSFKEKVHSVMEPLAAGLPVIVGPYHKNNREALQFSHQFINAKNTMVQSVADSEGFFDLLCSFSLAAKTNSALKSKIQKKVESSAGVSKKIVAWIQIKQIIQ